MRIGLIVIGIIVVIGIAFEIVGNLIAKRARVRFDRMSPDEQRKEQERMYRHQQMA